MKPQLTLGVIGHVDHGKTALVRALTGVETDRLSEERERGLSIVLGFAHLEFDQCIVDFIDVPGHEDFIRMMISGATGIDGVILVVAANESGRTALNGGAEILEGAPTWRSSSQFTNLKVTLHQRLLDMLNLSVIDKMPPEDFRREIGEMVRELLIEENRPLNQSERNQLVDDILDELLGLGPEEQSQKFGFLLEALSYGAPPHGGFAVGLDRIVALTLGMESIRDVVAFPKTATAACLMTGAPTAIPDEQLAEAGVAVIAKPKPDADEEQAPAGAAS